MGKHLLLSVSNLYSGRSIPTYRTHGKKVVHLSRVKIVQDLNLVQNSGSSRDIRRTAHVSVCVLWLEEETRELSSLHGQQPQLQSS